MQTATGSKKFDGKPATENGAQFTAFRPGAGL